MKMIKYNIISTGSKGNAVVFEDKVMIDCGVTFKALEPFYKNLKLILLTHNHSDHFKKRTIHKLAIERPTLRFACCRWLVPALVDCGVDKSNIDVLDFDVMYGYGICNVIPFYLTHNVPNCGYKVHFGNAGKLVYATDCNNLNGVSAKGYDLYMIEANHEEAVIQEKIKQKKADGMYAYEQQAARNHLSKEKADNWLYQNMKSSSIYIYMHCHQDEE